MIYGWGDVGNVLVSDLVSSTKNVQIAQGKNTADLNSTYIKWNPNSTTGGMNQMVQITDQHTLD